MTASDPTDSDHHTERTPTMPAPPVAMIHTAVLLPSDLRAAAQTCADEQDRSFSSFVRQAVVAAVKAHGPRRRRAEVPADVATTDGEVGT